MEKTKKMSKSMRKHIRIEKARIRREFFDIKEQKEKIAKLYEPDKPAEKTKPKEKKPASATLKRGYGVAKPASRHAKAGSAPTELRRGKEKPEKKKVEPKKDKPEKIEPKVELKKIKKAKPKLQ